MIIPIRCFSCNKVLGNKYERYVQMKQEDIEPLEIFRRLGIERLCCKTILTTHVNTIDSLLEKENDTVLESNPLIYVKRPPEKQNVRVLHITRNRVEHDVLHDDEMKACE